MRARAPSRGSLIADTAAWLERSPLLARGVVQALSIRVARNPRLVLVCNLHRVAPEGSPYWPALHPDCFTGLLDFLESRFQIVTFADLIAEDDGRPAAILSFDDGYRDFADVVLPVLRGRGIRANLNVIPTCVDTGEPPWNVKVYDVLDAAGSDLDKLDLPGFHSAAQDPERLGLELSSFLKQRPLAERTLLVEKLEAFASEIPDISYTPMLSRAQVVDIAKEHEVGAHSWSHDSMAYEGASYFRDDVERCEEWFKLHLGFTPSLYAFPNGSHRREQVDWLLSRGYRGVLLVGDRFSSRDARVHPRVTIYGPRPSSVRLRAMRPALGRLG
jgi:peptidoglycan/xylan/chitin deacetylase (PgdA/CDA1 family)